MSYKFAGFQDYDDEDEEDEDEEEEDDEEDDDDGEMGEEGEDSNEGSGDCNEPYEGDDTEVRVPAAPAVTSALPTRCLSRSHTQFFHTLSFHRHLHAAPVS